MNLFIQVNNNKVVELLKYILSIFYIMLELESSTKFAEEPPVFSDLRSTMRQGLLYCF